MVKNSRNLRAVFYALGMGSYSFKIITPDGTVLASGKGSESEVEARAAEWVKE